MEYVDTHCHLNFDSFDGDRSMVLERSCQVGVSRILNPGIDEITSQSAVSLAQTHEQVFAAIGIHPNSGNSWNGVTLNNLRNMASDSKVVAIGEIGLDYYRDHTSQDVQKRIFRMQLELAGEVGLPVVIHNRLAGNDVLTMLEKWCIELERYAPALAQKPGVLHSFSEDVSLAERSIALNFNIGITGPITFKNAPVLQHLVANIPISSMLIETDAPFLTPHPHRGQRNEPAYVRLIAEKIGAIKNLPLATVVEATTANAGRLFDW